jgi:hypothetical protein
LTRASQGSRVALPLFPVLAFTVLAACDDSGGVTGGPVPKGGLPSSASVASSNEALRDNARVILITIDGLRWQEVFDAKDSLARADQRPLMAHLHARIAKRGVGFGDKDRGSTVRTSSIKPISLPGYQSIFAGRQTACANNECARIDAPTLPEAVARQLTLPAGQVAAFASWSRLARAISSKDGSVLADVGPEGPPRGAGDPPWSNARWDDDTISRALSHLSRERPRFLYIGLLDTDQWAHAGERDRYLDAARAADRLFERIDTALEAMPAKVREQTTIIVTSDHGRGNGPLWIAHSRFDAARHVWLAARGPWVARAGLTRPTRTDVQHADIRPTVERLFGLCPTACEGASCGRVIEEITAGLHALPDPCARR